ncbi:MAG: glycosyltransferase family 39 protein [Phycisphaeraceae bacterium JB051]
MIKPCKHASTCMPWAPPHHEPIAYTYSRTHNHPLPMLSCLEYLVRMSIDASPTTAMTRNWYRDFRVWLLIVLTLGLYLQTLTFDMIGLDDPTYVSQNDMVQQGLNAQTFVWAWTTQHFGFYHPVTWLSHLVDVSLFGDHPGAFHVVNSIIHMFNTLLVWAVTTRLTGLRQRSWWIALIWAIHPLRVESVAWVAERKDVLCGMFSLLSLWFYACYLQRKRWHDYLGVTIMLVLAVLSKPMAVTLPCVMLLLDVWPAKRLGKRAVFEKLPWLMIAIGYAALTLTLKVDIGETVGVATVPLMFRVENMFWAYGQYLLMSILPIGLAVPYLLTQHPAWQVWISAAVFALITAFAIYRARKQPYLIVGWLWFVGMLLPITGILQTGQQSHADRFTYLPMIGLLVAVGWWLADAVRLPKWLKHPMTRAVLAAVLLLLSFRQVSFWRNDITLFSHTLNVTGYNPMAHHQLGVAYLQREQYEPAALHLYATIEHITHDPIPRKQLVKALIKLRLLDQAIEQLRWLVEYQPDEPNSHLQLAVLLYQLQGPTPTVIAHLNKAIALAPQWDKPRFMLNEIQRETGTGKTVN